MKISKILSVGIIALSVGVCAGTASATPVAISLVNSLNVGHSGMAVDSVTGKVYVRADYFDSAGSVKVYNNIADFNANVVATTITLAGVDTGTYLAAKNGVLYGREENALFAGDAKISAWDATTGTHLDGPDTIAGMGGSNGADTYDWGGFSGANVMQDATGLYVAGGKAVGSDWQVSKIDSLLNVTATTTVTTPDALGYGFVINGKFFAAQDFYSNVVSIAVDLTTGLQSAVNFVLTGGPGSPYWTNASYDYVTDTLFFRNYVGSTTTYKIDNASVAFGAPGGDPVPAPGALALLGLGLFGIGGLRRKKLA